MNDVNKPTVLVLGAGASYGYGFPLGRKLLDDACRLCLKSTPSLCDITGYTSTQFEEFGQRLAISGYDSVDWYLEVNPQDIPIGRVAIAAALAGYEDSTKLFPGPEDHWYRTILNRWWSVDEKSLAFGSHVTILTFNYDRSLEHYLSTTVGGRTKQEPEAVTVKVEGADEVVIADGPTIIHLHGQLRGSYSTTWSSDRLDTDGLLLLSSAEHDSAEFERGRAAINECKSLYFLGFGFNSKSVSRLGDFTAASPVNNIEISGTHNGFNAIEWSDTKSELFPHSWVERPGVNSVYSFVRENQI